MCLLGLFIPPHTPLCSCVRLGKGELEHNRDTGLEILLCFSLELGGERNKAVTVCAVLSKAEASCLHSREKQCPTLYWISASCKVLVAAVTAMGKHTA